MLFYKNYGPKQFFATFVSLLGGLAGALGVVGIIAFFTSKFKDNRRHRRWVIGIALFFGLRKLADIIAVRKAKKLLEREQKHS